MTANQWTTTGRPMGRIAQRFWGGVGRRILDSGALDGTQYKPGQTADEGARLGEYDRRWAYYLNDDLYGRLYRAGLAAADMPVTFNPIPAVVDFYGATVLGGDMRPQAVAEEADDDALGAAVALLWQWSNFDLLRRDVVVTAAVLQDVFLKVAERTADDALPTAVYMQDIPPQSVRWWEVDERGYLTAIRIDTERLESVFSGVSRRHTLVEVWRKVWPDGQPGGARWYEIGPGQMLSEERLDSAARVVTFDELGYDFIPVVWGRVDTPWRRQIDHIDRYNTVAWQAARLNRPLAVIRAGGTDAQGRPLAAPLGAAEALDTLYSEEGDGVMGVIRLPGVSTMEWSGQPVDFAALNVMLAELKESIIDGLPEYRVATLRGVQVATETLQLLMNQAEGRALAMRAHLERALTRAQMMAITIAQVAGVRPEVFGESVLGTFDDGRTEHVFAPRPVFEKSATARAAEAAALVAAGATLEGAARVAGFTDEQVADLVNLSLATFPEEGR